MHLQIKQQVKGLGLSALVILTLWGCGTTRSTTGLNNVLPQSQYPDYTQISFIDNVSPNVDVIQSNGAGVVSANAVIKIYDSNLVFVTQGNAAADGSFAIAVGNNTDYDGEDNAQQNIDFGIYKDTLYLTATAPGRSESLATFVKVGGWQ